MLFNSIDFAVFLPIVFILYWFVTQRNLKVQNILIIVASYTFYGWWDWRFLFLIFFSTCVDYLVGQGLSKQEDQRKRKILLWTSIAVNLGFLGFFKYYNFFLDSFVDAFTFFGRDIRANSLNIILPVGISFYTFQTLSYTIDVYKRRIEPTRDFISFAAFVGFFPQLVAGPIERASHLLPQFTTKRVFSKTLAIDGLQQMLWGLFKKIVIADNCAIYVDEIFSNYTNLPGSTLLLGVVLFAFQIYGDFSGYSDIAIGTGRLFGFDLMKNFATPYFSRTFAEFWRRWHISLSTWMRDYLYMPLGGPRGNSWRKIRNVFAIFLISGLWHGANWTFIFWGGMHAIFFLPVLFVKRRKRVPKIVAQGKLLPSFREVFQMLRTFLLVCLSLVLFRAADLAMSVDYYAEIFSFSIFTPPENFPWDITLLIIVFMTAEWFNREREHTMEFKIKKHNIAILRALAVSVVIWAILIWGNFGNKEFIYFQF